MSRTSVIVALLVAIGLGVGAWLAVRSPSAAPGATERVLDFDPATIVELTFSTGSRVETIRPGGVPGTWQLSAGNGTWPLNPGNVRGALRVLSTIEGERLKAAPTVAESGRVTLRTSNGGNLSLQFAEGALAGKAVVIARGLEEADRPGRIYRIPADLAAAFVSTGPRAWRTTEAFGGFAEDSSAMRLETPAADVAMSRIQGRWGLTEPIVVPADPPVVQKLIAEIGSIRIADFLDGGAPSPETTGVDRPTAVLILEADRRSVEGDQVRKSTERRELRIGQPADIGARTVYAAIVAGEGSTTLVALDRTALDRVSMDPAAYIARVAIGTPSADIGRVRIGKRAFQRRLEEWEVNGQAATIEEAVSLSKLLALLTEARADTVSIGVPEGWIPAARAEVASMGGTPIGAAEFGRAEDGSAIIVDGSVTRQYKGQEGTVEWVAAQADE